MKLESTEILEYIYSYFIIIRLKSTHKTQDKVVMLMKTKAMTNAGWTKKYIKNTCKTNKQKKKRHLF